MKNNNIDKQLDLLKQVKRVETPPFLLTRIRQKAQQKEAETMLSPQLVWGITASFVVLFLINIAVVSTQFSAPVQDISLLESMNLLPNNTIY